MLAPILARGRVGIICEEAHRSHFLGSRTGSVVNRVFGKHCFFEDASRAGLQPKNISYIGFTATPDARALRLFGTRCEFDSALSLWKPVHSYHVGEAEADGVVLDVLADYERREWPKEGGERARAAWLVAHFQERCAGFPPQLRGRAAAMVVCPSRAHVMQWVTVLREYVDDTGWAPHMMAGRPDAPRAPACHGVFGFFSGNVGDENESEERLNGGLWLTDACAEARILVVCRKLETGYDNPDLCVMYVDRKLDGAKSIVQVLSRLNRRGLSGKRAFVVDFHNEPERVAAAFGGFREEVTLCSDPAKAALTARFEGVLDRLGALLERNAKVTEISAQEAKQAKQCARDYVELREALGLPQLKDARDYVDAAVQALASEAAAVDATAQAASALGLTDGRSRPAQQGPWAFVEQQVAKRQLLKIKPSARYGGDGQKPAPSRLTWQPCEVLERQFRGSMASLGTRSDAGGAGGGRRGDPGHALRYRRRHPGALQRERTA